MSLFAPVGHFLDAPIRGEGRSSRWFSWIIRGIGNFVFKLCFRYRVEGRENLDVGEGKAAVVAGNHFSMADPVMGFLALRGNIRFIGKQELFEGNAFVAQGLARCGGIPVRRDTADRVCIKRAVAALRRGEYVGIYPEGTRHHSADEPVSNKAGAVLIANMAQSVIVPVGTVGTERIKPAGSHLLHFPRLVIRFGVPVDPHDFDYLPKPQRAEACIDEVMRRSYALRAGEDPAPFQPPAESAEVPVVTAGAQAAGAQAAGAQTAGEDR